jgi:sigma-E factor negative regulatory protein RseA
MTAEDRDREALSALMDGEAQELELRRTLEAVAGDGSLRHRWQRQHRVRDALHGQSASHTDIDISKGVLQALETGKPMSRNPLWSMAVAASVTFAVVMGGQQLLLPSTAGSPVPVVSELGGAVVPVLGAQPVQASLGSKGLSGSAQQSTTLPDASQSIAAVYDRLARDRYRALNGRHAVAAAYSHPAPYISYVRVPESQLETSAAE